VRTIFTIAPGVEHRRRDDHVRREIVLIVRSRSNALFSLQAWNRRVPLRWPDGR
jgi:hypothetical protein